MAQAFCFKCLKKVDQLREEFAHPVELKFFELAKANSLVYSNQGAKTLF